MSCQTTLLIWYGRYKRAPHLTLTSKSDDDSIEELVACLPAKEHSQYFAVRAEYARKVQQYGVNDYILQDYQRQQLNLLWSQMDLISKGRALLSNN